MTPEIIFGALGVIFVLVGAAWILLGLAGRQWEQRQAEREERQEEQFSILRLQITGLQAKVEGHYSDMARLELKISETEKVAMREFASKAELATMRTFVEMETRSIQDAVKDLGKSLDAKLDQVFNKLDRKADKGEQ